LPKDFFFNYQTLGNDKGDPPINELERGRVYLISRYFYSCVNCRLS
jgi:hypothetical protein